MANELPNREFSGYEGICQECKKVIKTNFQGNEIGSHNCKKMKEYTVAVVFSTNGREVLLQLKNRPKWQEGKWNFPGGKVEPNEVPIKCVIREFQEECSLNIEESRWNYVGVFFGNDESYNGSGDYKVHVFVTQVKENENPIQGEDQPVYWFLNNSLPDSVIPNLRWIIPLILNKVKFFNIEYLP